MKLYCGFKLDDSIVNVIQHAMEAAKVELPLVITAKDRLHVTTAFLGEMDEQDARNILRSAAGEHWFYCCIGKPNSWPGILYFQVQSNGAERVRNKQAASFQRLTGRSLWPSVFVPHVTLAKTEGPKAGADKQVQEALSRIEEYCPGSFAVRQLCLFHKAQVIETITLQEPA